MSLDAALQAILTGDAGVAALVGTRVYAVTAPQGDTLPDITYQRIASEPVHARTEPGLIRAEVQVDCWAATLAAAAGVRDAVVAALSRYSGTAGSTVIQDALLMNDWEGHDTESVPVGATDTGVYRRTLEFAVWYEE